MLNPEDIESSELFRDTLEAYFVADDWRQFGAPIGAKVVLFRARYKAVSELGSATAWELIGRVQQKYRYIRDDLEEIDNA